MIVHVKYRVISPNAVEYGCFHDDGKMIENLRIKDKKVPLGGVSSSIEWMRQDIHRLTDELKERFEVEHIEYVIIEPAIEVFSATPYFRYKLKQVAMHTTELRLQQLWQGDEGTQKWEWVETVSINEPDVIQP